MALFLEAMLSSSLFWLQPVVFPPARHLPCLLLWSSFSMFVAAELLPGPAMQAGIAEIISQTSALGLRGRRAHVSG